MIMLIFLSLNIITVVLFVAIHYLLFIYILSNIGTEDRLQRLPIFLYVHLALIVHVVEIALFALVYLGFDGSLHYGQLLGDYDGGFNDCFYFSLSCYTSVGFGDIRPEGWLRFTAGVEALLGLMMITWTASLLYLAMQKLAENSHKKQQRHRFK